MIIAGGLHRTICGAEGVIQQHVRATQGPLDDAHALPAARDVQLCVRQQHVQEYDVHRSPRPERAGGAHSRIQVGARARQ